MNIVDRRIHFARLPHVDAVYRLEQTRDAYAWAIDNITPNSRHSSKIHPATAGIDDADGVIECPLNSQEGSDSSIEAVNCDRFKATRDAWYIAGDQHTPHCMHAEC